MSSHNLSLGCASTTPLYVAAHRPHTARDLPQQRQEQNPASLRVRGGRSAPHAPARTALHWRSAWGCHRLHLPDTTALGSLKGQPTGIQFFVFPKEVIVHLIVCGFEIINVWLVGRWSWKLHVSPCPKGPDAESPFAERHRRRESVTVGLRQTQILKERP